MRDGGSERTDEAIVRSNPDQKLGPTKAKEREGIAVMIHPGPAQGADL